MKVVDVHEIIRCGAYPGSKHWRATKTETLEAIRACDWPPGSGSFTIYPQSGRKRGEGNGVKPIRDRFVAYLRDRGWVIEGAAQNALGQDLGEFDAVIEGPDGPIVVEWETGNISSSHRSMNKLTLLVYCGKISAGVLVVPSRALYVYLTDRIGNIKELEPYFALWRAVPCQKGVLEIVVIEHDATSEAVPKIPKGTDGRALR